MKARSRFLPVIALLGLCLGAGLQPARADEAKPAPDKAKTEKVKAFNGIGLLVTRHTFFNAAKGALEAEKDFKAPAEPLADLLFVSEETGVYNLLEHPANKKALEGIKPGASLQVTGKLYVAGALLLLDSAVPVATFRAIDVKKYSSAAGEEVTLTGTNRCQCQLDLGGLERSCTLGHLHHLQTADGTLYHYLPFGAGAGNHAGRGSHGKKVRVVALLLPGNNLLVRASHGVVEF